ncbi:MAG: Panacea domain-containing protein [Anaerolineales bacterium]
MDKYIPEFNEKKTTEAANILLQLNGGKMNYMKLIKLLYFVDKEAMKERERPITYDVYYSMKDGQVLSNVLDLVKDNKHGEYWHKYIERCSQYTVKLTNEDIEINHLTPFEVKLIKTIFERLGKYDQFSLGKLTKRGSEYKKTESRILTPIEDIYSDLGYEPSDIIEITKDLSKKALLDTLFER